MLGLLAIEDSKRYSAALIDVVLNAEGDAVHQILGVVERNPKSKDLKDFVPALIQWIFNSQSQRSAETGAFHTLAVISPSLLSTTPWDDHWGRWMPHARAALADAIGISDLSGDDVGTALKLLRELLGDSSYAVRRAGAKAYAKLNSAALANICLEWSAHGNADLVQRAAEAAEWLGADNRLTIDNDILRLLMHHPEPSVRSATRRAAKSLRRRIWAKHCLDQILRPRLDANSWVGSGYRYGEALARLGDDDVSDALLTLARDDATPPNVRHWLSGVIKEINRNWKESVSDWPEPWLPWSGTLERMEGNVVIRGERKPATFSLWLRRRRDPSEHSGWGGAMSFDNTPHNFGFLLTGEPGFQIDIPGRTPADALFSATGTDDVWIFVGNGGYPEKAVQT